MTAPLGVIADDLTGAGDVAGLLARLGARPRLVVGVPDGPAAPGAGAMVVALKSRTAPVAEAEALSGATRPPRSCRSTARST